MNEIIVQKKEYLTKMALASLKRTANEYVNLSQICHEYHQEFGYQDYSSWIKDDLGLGTTRGQQLLNVYDRFGSTTETVVTNLPTEILFLLAAPSTPESARTEAIEKAENGEKLTIKEAKQLVEAHRRIDALEKDLTSAKDQIPTDDIKAKIEDLEARLEAEKAKPAVIQYQDKIPDGYEELQKRKDELAVEKMQLKAEMSQMKAGHDAEIKKIAESKDTIPADYSALSIAKETLTRDKGALSARIERINAENEILASKVRQLKAEQDEKIAQAVKLRMRELQDEFDTKEKQLASVQARIDALQPEMNRLERKVGDLSAIRESAKEIRQHLMGISIVLGDLFSDVAIPESANKELLILANEMAQGATAFRNFLTGTKHIGGPDEELFSSSRKGI